MGIFFTFQPSEDRDKWIEQVKDFLQVPR